MGRPELRVLLLDDGAHLKKARLVVGDHALTLTHLLDHFRLLRAFGLVLVLELLDDQELVLNDLLERLEAQFRQLLQVLLTRGQLLHFLGSSVIHFLPCGILIRFVLWKKVARRGEKLDWGQDLLLLSLVSNRGQQLATSDCAHHPASRCLGPPLMLMMMMMMMLLPLQNGQLRAVVIQRHLVKGDKVTGRPVP